MTNQTRLSRWQRVGAAGGVGLPLLLTLALCPAEAHAAGEAPAQAPPAAGTAPVPRPVLSLAECLQLAFQRQPVLAARRASLAAAEDSARGLDNLRVPTFLARDLPVRRKQAALGVTAAAVGLDQAERETAYAVTRTYFTAIYARDQEDVARGVVEHLSAVHGTVERLLKAGDRDIADTDVDRTTVYLELAETRRLQAAEGMERALAALKEAIGLEPGCCLDVPPGHLPEPNLRICCADVVAWALARRGDLVQATTFAEVTGLEVEAQGTSHRPRKDTFATGADIHALQVPQAFHDTEYRPGGELPEMPNTMVGSRSDRVQHAQSLNERAAAVADKTRNLIVLEAEDAFRRWEEASRKLEHTRKAIAGGDRLSENTRNQFTARLKVRLEEVITAQVLAAQARSQHNETLYQEILALADLERITAGAFCAGLAAPPLAPAPASAPTPPPNGEAGKPTVGQ
jgi:outer membrane protein TolC